MVLADFSSAGGRASSGTSNGDCGAVVSCLGSALIHSGQGSGPLVPVLVVAAACVNASNCRPEVASVVGRVCPSYWQLGVNFF